MKFAIFLILFPTAALADCTQICDVLQDIRPGALWTMRGEKYADLEWLDQAQTKPTGVEVVAAMTACAQNKVQRAAVLRAARFTVKLSTATAAQKINALIQILDLDQ